VGSNAPGAFLFYFKSVTLTVECDSRVDAG